MDSVHSTGYIFLNELCEVYKSIKLWGLHTQFCIAGLQDSSPEEPKMPKKILVGRGFAPDPTGEAHSSPTKPLAGG